MIRKYVHDGEQIPRGYRIAWHDYFMRYNVAYPIGLHVIASMLRRLWEFSYWCPRSRIEVLLGKARSEGYKDGYKAGYQAGIEKNAIEAFCEAIKDHARSS